MSVEIPVGFCPDVQRLITDGRFQDATEVVSEGLRLVIEREKLREGIRAGIDELDAGNKLSADEVYAEARRRVQAIADQEN